MIHRVPILKIIQSYSSLLRSSGFVLYFLMEFKDKNLLRSIVFSIMPLTPGKWTGIMDTNLCIIYMLFQYVRLFCLVTGSRGFDTGVLVVTPDYSSICLKPPGLDLISNKTTVTVEQPPSLLVSRLLLIEVASRLKLWDEIAVLGVCPSLRLPVCV